MSLGIGTMNTRLVFEWMDNPRESRRLGLFDGDTSTSICSISMYHLHVWMYSVYHAHMG